MLNENEAVQLMNESDYDQQPVFDSDNDVEKILVLK